MQHTYQHQSTVQGRLQLILVFRLGLLGWIRIKFWWIQRATKPGYSQDQTLYDLPTSMYSRFMSKSYMCQGQDISGQWWNLFVENDADTQEHDRPPITSSLSDASKVCASCFADSTELTCQHFISLYLKSVKAVAGHRPWVHV